MEYQKVSLDFSDFCIFNIAFTFCVVSSWFVSKGRRNGVGLKSLIYFACFGVSIEKVAMWHPFFNAYACCRKLLMSTVICLL